MDKDNFWMQGENVDFQIVRKDNIFAVYHRHKSHDLKVKTYTKENINELYKYIQNEINYHLVGESKA